MAFGGEFHSSLEWESLVRSHSDVSLSMPLLNFAQSLVLCWPLPSRYVSMALEVAERIDDGLCDRLHLEYISCREWPDNQTILHSLISLLYRYFVAPLS